MKEINRNILIDGLSALPAHKAPEVIWENIDALLFNIPVDILPVHLPPPTIWGAIEKGIAGSWLSWKVISRGLVILFLFLIIGSSNYYFGIDRVNNNEINPRPSDNKNILTGVVENETEIKDEILNNDDSSFEIDVIHVLPDEEESINLENEDLDHSSLNNVDYELHNEAFELYNIDLCQSPLTSHDINSVFSDNPESDLSVNRIIDPCYKKIKNNFQYCDFNRIEKSILIGPGIGYQYFFNSSIPENTRISYWISGGVRILYKRERFSIETGIGIVFSADKSDFSYDYLTNELVDSYEYVDSVHFDPITGTTEYFTTTVEVFDSIAHTSLSSVEKKYTYVQIPFLIGYNILKSNTLCVNINAGIVYTTEINVKDYMPTIFHENSRITSIGSNDVQRNSQMFNITVGIGMDWYASKKITLSLTPSFNYYTNHMYQNIAELKNPMSAGIRFGFYYKF